MDEGYIDAALVSYLEGDGGTWKAKPGVATNQGGGPRRRPAAATPTRPTRSPSTRPSSAGFSKLALVGHELPVVGAAGDVDAARSARSPSRSCSTSACCARRPSTTRSSRSCSRPSTASRKADIKKMNIKGVFQIWTQRRRATTRCQLKECHAWTREGCNHCPDFAAEHADISTGGIGKYNDWTLTIVRTELGREIIERMIADGSIEARPGDDDPRRDRADAQAGREEPGTLADGRGAAGAGRAARAQAQGLRSPRPLRSAPTGFGGGLRRLRHARAGTARTVVDRPRQVRGRLRQLTRRAAGDLVLVFLEVVPRDRIPSVVRLVVLGRVGDVVVDAGAEVAVGELRRPAACRRRSSG